MNKKIPDKITSIPVGLLSDCTGLKKVELPGQLERIEAAAFYNCKSLKKITIPGKVSYVNEWAFRECGSLKELVFPESVQKIDYMIDHFNVNRSFEGCSHLQKITILNPRCYINLPNVIAKNIVICGPENSSAQRYAEQAGIRFELPSGEKLPKRWVYYLAGTLAMAGVVFIVIRKRKREKNEIS